MTIRRSLIALLVGGALLTACGDSGALDAAKGDATATTAKASSATAAGGVSTSAAKAGSSDTGALFGGKCVDASRAYGAALAGATAALTGGGKDVDASIQQLSVFADQAPAEIKNDLKTVATAYAAFTKTLKDAGYTPGSVLSTNPAVLAALQKAASEINRAEVKAAQEKLTAWFNTNCKA